MKRYKKHELVVEGNIYLRDYDEDGDPDESSDERAEYSGIPRDYGSGGSGGTAKGSAGGCATVLLPSLAFIGILVWLIV